LYRYAHYPRSAGALRRPSRCPPPYCFVGPLLFFFNDPPPPEISPLSLHDALPISWITSPGRASATAAATVRYTPGAPSLAGSTRSEEHTSELQSLTNLVCRLLLEKKKPTTGPTAHTCS